MTIRLLLDTTVITAPSPAGPVPRSAKGESDNRILKVEETIEMLGFDNSGYVQ